MKPLLEQFLKVMATDIFGKNTPIEINEDSYMIMFDTSFMHMSSPVSYARALGLEVTNAIYNISFIVKDNSVISYNKNNVQDFYIKSLTKDKLRLFSENNNSEYSELIIEAKQYHNCISNERISVDLSKGIFLDDEKLASLHSLFNVKGFYVKQNDFDNIVSLPDVISYSFNPDFFQFLLDIKEVSYGNISFLLSFLGFKSHKDNEDDSCVWYSLTISSNNKS